MTILRPRHGGGTSAILGYEGATIDRVITPTADLFGVTQTTPARA